VAILIASSMVARSTEAMGLNSERRREDMDMRLVDIDDWEDRPETTEEDGEVDRGVERSDWEPAELYAYDAIGTIGGLVKGGGDERRKERNRRTGKRTDRTRMTRGNSGG